MKAERPLGHMTQSKLIPAQQLQQHFNTLTDYQRTDACFSSALLTLITRVQAPIPEKLLYYK